MIPTAVAALLLVGPAHGFGTASLVRPASSATARASGLRLGLFDGLAKAFENKDYSKSPATYEQTNARASHILVDTEAEATEIKGKIEAGDVDFSEAAVKFSKCSSKERGGKLGKFVPGASKYGPDFDDCIFGLYDTGTMNPRNEAALFEPINPVNTLLGPVKTDAGFHLITIETRYIADFDFRLKEEGVVEP